MKKTITTLTLLIGMSYSTFVIASQKSVNFFNGDSKYANQFLKSKNSSASVKSNNNKVNKKTSNRKPWEISMGISTANDKIPNSLKEIKWKEDLSIQYSFTPSIYASIGANYQYPKEIGLEATAGLQAAKGLFRPYVEINYDQEKRENNKSLSLIGYDVGINVVLNKYISPYIQIDNFSQQNREGLTTGVNLSVTQNMIIGLGYKWGTESHNNSLALKLSYIF